MMLLSPRGPVPAQNQPDLPVSTAPRSQYDVVMFFLPGRPEPAQNHPDLADATPPRSQHDVAEGTEFGESQNSGNVQGVEIAT